MNIFCIRPHGFNVGNDAIFTGLKPLIESAFGSLVNLISIPATSRYEAHGRSGLTAKMIHEINQYGDGVIVGGGNLYENGELHLDTESLPKLEPPLMLFSLSRGRIYNRLDQLADRTDVMTDRNMRSLNQKALLSLARDIATHRYLQNLGFNEAILGGCPTMFLDSIVSRLPSLPEADKNCTLVSVRNPFLMNISLRRQMGIHDQIEQIVSLLRAQGHADIRLLCHDHRDIPFAASFGDLPYIYTQDPLLYLSLLRHCRLNVTYRVHSALPCMAFGADFIKLSYDERAISLMETVGFGQWNINIVTEPHTLQVVAARLDDLSQLARIKENAAPKWQELKRAQTSAMAQFVAAATSHRNATGAKQIAAT